MSIVNISTRSDSDWYRGFYYRESGGAAINLTGSSLRMMIRAHAADNTTLIDLSTDNGNIVIIDAAAGRFSVLIPFVHLLVLPVGGYAHSMILTYPGGRREEVWHGALTHEAGPTR